MCTRPFTSFTDLFWTWPRTFSCPSWSEGVTMTQDTMKMTNERLHYAVWLRWEKNLAEKPWIRAKVILGAAINTCSVQLPNVVDVCISFPPPFPPPGAIQRAPSFIFAMFQRLCGRSLALYIFPPACEHNCSELLLHSWMFQDMTSTSFKSGILKLLDLGEESAMGKLSSLFCHMMSLLSLSLLATGNLKHNVEALLEVWRFILNQGTLGIYRDGNKERRIWLWRKTTESGRCPFSEMWNPGTQSEGNVWDNRWKKGMPC